MLPELLALQKDPPVLHSNETFMLSESKERKLLMSFYATGIPAYKGDQTSWPQSINSVIEDDGNNPHYRWTVGHQ